MYIKYFLCSTLIRMCLVYGKNMTTENIVHNILMIRFEQYLVVRWHTLKKL